MTLRFLADDALKTGDPALCRTAPDHRRIMASKLPRPKGPAHDQMAQDMAHAADWQEHVEAGRIGATPSAIDL
jgi:hypothetical protein